VATSAGSESHAAKITTDKSEIRRIPHHPEKMDFVASLKSISA
jgi:hypothetical protein